MIKFKVNGKSYNLKNTWQEITIADGIKLSELELPKALQKSEIQNGDLLELESINFAKSVLEILSGCKDFENTHAGDVVYFFRYVLQIALDVFNLSPVSYMPEMPVSFTFENETYYYPTSQEFEGALIPATNLDAVSFCESSNLLAALNDVKKEGLKQMPLFIACYCKKNGETFDQFTALERSKKFVNLPMTVAWEVFFCMAHFLTLQMAAIPESLKKENRRRTLKKVIRGFFQLGYTLVSKRATGIGKQSKWQMFTNFLKS